MLTKILINAIGKRLQFGRAFQVAARQAGVEVMFADANPNAPGMVAFGGVQSPLINDPAYAHIWAGMFREHGITHVLSIIDTDQIALSRAAATSGVVFLGPDQEVVDICQDKWVFHETLAAKGVPVVPTDLAPWPEGDFISKDRRGSCGSAVEFHAAGSTPQGDPETRIFQPALQGRHIDVDFIFDGTRIWAPQKEILAKENGESFVMAMCDAPEVTALIARTAHALGYRGVGNADVWWYDGAWRMMEINPRYGGNAPASIAAGCDLISAQIAFAQTGRLPVGTGREGVDLSACFVKSFHLERV